MFEYMGNLQVLLVNSGNMVTDDTRSIGGVDITAVVEKPKDALSILYNISIDIVVVCLGVPASDAFGFLESVNAMNVKPAVALVVPEDTLIHEDEYTRMARKLSVKFVYRGSILHALREVVNKLRAEKAGEEAVVVKVVSDKILDERLANVFIASGIPPHIKGYQFLREAVKQSVRIPSMINNITKQLYPAIAEKFNTSPSKVERAIRHAIEVAWSRGKIENINSIYGIKVFSKGEKPTNGELIALVSDKMIIELVN